MFIKEAWLAFQPALSELKSGESVEVDFDGVDVLTPSWADEFITPLQQKYPKTTLLNTQNPTVQETLKMMETTKAAKNPNH